MGRTRDGAVIPSFLSSGHTPREWSGHDFDNVQMRMGEVQAIVYPEDKGSRTKRFIEYDVLVQQRTGGRGISKLYKSCLLANWYCGLADYARFTLRCEQSQSTDKAGLGRGSKVLIACINGETNHAYIVGGVRDQTDERDKGIKDLGHHMMATFNGVTAMIDKDGQLSVTYGGKTGIDGKVDSGVDSNAPGTTMTFQKDGGWLVADKDAKNSIFIDHANKKVVIKRDQAFELGGATDHMLLGESFRNEQKALHNKLQSLFSSLSKLLQQAAVQLNAAVSTAPGAPLPQVVAAGALFQAASQTADQMGQAVQAFEQNAASKNSFLSKYNSND